jgi:hypothetical protein
MPEAKAYPWAKPRLRTLSIESRCGLRRLFGLAQKTFGVLSHPSPNGVSFMVAFRFQGCRLFTCSHRRVSNVPPFEHFSVYFDSLV